MRSADATRSEAFVWALINAAPDGILVVQDAGRVVLANRRAEDLFGYDRGELLSMAIEELLPEPLSEAHRAHRLRNSTDPCSRAMREGRVAGRRRDGTELAVEISLSPMYQDSTRLIIATIRPPLDLTRHDPERRLGEQERIDIEIAQTVVHRLQTIGLALADAPDLPPGSLARRCTDVIDTLDDLIHEVRTTVFRQRL